MAANKFKSISSLGLLAFGLFALTATGCQTNVGGQTLPSAWFLRDDVQYFPAGPETQLWRQRQALERYEIEREAELDLGDAAP